MTHEMLTCALAARGVTAPEVSVFPELPSTNTYLRERALAGAPHGSVCLAVTQSAGKGSRGRTFLSPVGGLYCSVLLRDTPDPMRITCAAAVAVRAAILECFGVPADIKWVNDLYVAGKKVCGILAEGVTANNRLSAVVLGFGVNLTLPNGGFDPAIADIAGALPIPAPDASARANFVASVLSHLYLYLTDPDRAYMDSYRAHNLVCGKTVTYHIGDTRLQAVVTDIDRDGALLLIDENSNTRRAFAGEVSLPDFQTLS